MSSELQNIIITIDSREKNEKRIKAVETWGTTHGAIVELSKLDLCDYRILGEFRGYQINIGIEAKSLSDFCSCDYNDLKRKLFDSFEIFDEVALFIESGNYSFLNEGFGKSAIINPAVRDGSANVCNLAQLEGCVHTLERNGIFVNQLRSETQFPYSIENLLTYCIHDHDVIKHDPKMYLRSYKHTLRSFMTNVQVNKAVSSYPNLFWLCSASEESYKEVFGAKTGTQIYNFIRNPELVTPEWKNKHFRDGTDKMIISEPDDNDKSTEVLPPIPSVLSLNHSSTVSALPPINKLDDTQGTIQPVISSPIQCSGVQGTGLKQTPSTTTHSETTILPDPAITSTPDEELFGKTNSDWRPVTKEELKRISEEEKIFAERTKDYKLSIRKQLEVLLEKPHTQQECVTKLSNFSKGAISDHIYRMKREGIIVEFDDKTLVMAKI